MNTKKINTDCIEVNKNLTRDELLSAIIEMKKDNARLKQEAEILTGTLDKQVNNIYDLEVDIQEDMVCIDFLCESMVDLENKRRALEESLKGCIVNRFTNKGKPANQTHFFLKQNENK